MEKETTIVVDGHRIDFLRIGDNTRCEILIMDRDDTKVIKQMFKSDIISAMVAINEFLTSVPKI